MGIEVTKNRNNYFLHDTELYPDFSEQWFDADSWRRTAVVSDVELGRGGAVFIQSDKHALVLRHYNRGGQMASLLGDRYCWLGLARTRAWREWWLLKKMRELELPVPAPVAARVVRWGIVYRCDILLDKITDSEPLSQKILHSPLPRDVWFAIGQCIRRFHHLGVNHADLNAHNILLTEENNVYIIDFDKGRFSRDGSWRENNVMRLRRSLNKLLLQTNTKYTEDDWYAFMQGYSD